MLDASKVGGIIILSLFIHQMRKIREMGALAFLWVASISLRRLNLPGSYMDSILLHVVCYEHYMPSKVMLLELHLLVVAVPKPGGWYIDV